MSKKTAKTTRYHMGFEVAYAIRLLEDIPYGKRDLKWKETRDSFEKLKQKGIKIASSCPQSVEVKPGVWECPGHPVKK